MNYMETKYSILEGIFEKNLEHKDTTSLKWKRDVIDFFYDKELKSCLEIGSCYGVTTKVLSSIFKTVDTIEFNPRRIAKAKEYCTGITNINFILNDAYNIKTYDDLKRHYDVVVIDCMHLYDNVIFDINQALTRMNIDTGIYLVFDDYGHPDSPGVHKAVNEAIQAGLVVEAKIGEPAGFTVNRTDGTKFTTIHQEGLILSYGI
jgi:hypothetical protein